MPRSIVCWGFPIAHHFEEIVENRNETRLDKQTSFVLRCAGGMRTCPQSIGSIDLCAPVPTIFLAPSCCWIAPSFSLYELFSAHCAMCPPRNWTSPFFSVCSFILVRNLLSSFFSPFWWAPTPFDSFPPFFLLLLFPISSPLHRTSFFFFFRNSLSCPAQSHFRSKENLKLCSHSCHCESFTQQKRKKGEEEEEGKGALNYPACECFRVDCQSLNSLIKDQRPTAAALYQN